MMAKSIIQNKELVSRMSLEQKLNLITSTKFGENNAVDNYAFPVFKLSSDPAAQTEGVSATLFPSEKALACTWNFSLIKDVYKCIGNEAKANVPNAYFDISDNLAKEGISEDCYYTAGYLAHKTLGLNASGVCVNFEDAPECDDKRELLESVKQIKDAVFLEAQPDSVLFRSTEEMREFSEKYSYEGLLYGVASNKEEAAAYIYLGCSFVFLTEDFSVELLSYLSDLMLGYEKAKREYQAGKISLAEFDRRQRDLEILDGGLIDAACGKFVSVLLKLKENNPASVRERLVSLNDSHTAKFNEKFHDTIAYRAAQQSAVLLKNRGVLPLNGKTKLAVVGEFAKNPAYQTGLTANVPTAVRLPFEAINEYDLNAIGYAHGYLKGESGRGDLIKTASDLCAEADVALVYLCAERGAKGLPKGQTELLEALAEKSVKIVAVVSADGALDFSFAEYCEAVLFTYRNGQGGTDAVLDILTGAVSPSGKLTETCAGGYPFGFGLSYTQFEYKNLKVTENGVSCTVVNTGEHDGFATVQLYVQKDGSETTLSQKQLRGFSKVFLKKNDGARVEIPFDGNTFRTYDFKHECYRIEGGDYRVFLAESAESVKLSGELTLSEYKYQNDIYRNEPEENDGTMPVGFTDNETEAKIRKEKKGLSFGLKLFLAIVFLLYYNSVGAVLLFTNIIADKNITFYAVTGALLFLGDLLAVIFIIVISKKRKWQKYLHPNDVLSEMVDKVDEFQEIAKLSYAEPLPQADEDRSVGAETEAAVQEETASYKTAFDEPEEGDVTFTEQISFSEICTNFRAYALSRGVAVEPSSVRALIAAVTSAKLVFLSCKNREVLPDLLSAINTYFGNTEYVSASGDWTAPGDLLWRREGERYVSSDFANAVNAARKSPDKNCVVILNGAEPENLQSYFGSFIDYALCPSEEHSVALNGELSLVLPHNVCYLLVPASEEYCEKLTRELVQASLQIEIIAGKTEPAAEETELKTLSCSTLTELLAAARKKYYLSEKIWKKIDGLAEAVCATERFEIGNKDVLQLEKFTAVLLDCGGDESEAANCVFTAKIVPLLKLLKTYQAENGGKTLFGFIEKCFGDEDLSRIQKSLVRMN